jgi:hypothetical protein
MRPVEAALAEPAISAAPAAPIAAPPKTPRRETDPSICMILSSDPYPFVFFA